MENEAPKIDVQTSEEFVIKSKEKIIEISGGKLTDFSPQSVLSALVESQSLVAGEMQAKLNGLSKEIEENRLKIFGIERINARKSLGAIRITLENLYPTIFQLPRGYRLNINNLVFETIADLIIPEFRDTGEIAIESVSLGAVNNIKNENPNIVYPALERVQKIELVDDITGGVDEESVENYEARIYEQLRTRDTLVSTEDFENDLKDYLGENSGVLAIGRLLPGKNGYDNGYVHVFGLNEDGSELNVSQVSQLQSYYNNKVAMATVSVSSLSLFDVEIGVILTFISRFSAGVLAEEIKLVIENYFKPSNIRPGEQVLSKAIEYRLQNNVEGIFEGAINVYINGLAQPIDMPENWFFPNLKRIELGLIPQGTSSSVEFIYDY